MTPHASTKDSPRSFLSALIRLLPGSEAALKSWRLAMNVRIEEAQESIRSEGVDHEVWFCLRREEEHFMIAVMVKPNVAGLPKQANHPIDEIHKSFKQAAWDRSVRFATHEIVCIDGRADVEETRCVMRCFTVSKDRALFAEQWIRSALVNESPNVPGVTHSVFRHDLDREVIVSWLTTGDDAHLVGQLELQESFLRACPGFVHGCEPPDVLLDVRPRVQRRSTRTEDSFPASVPR